MISPVIRRITKNVEHELERKFTGSCKVSARVGDEVNPESIIGHCEVSAGQRLVKIAHELGVSGSSVKKYLLRKLGDRIYRGEIIARRGLIFGVGKKEVKSPADGVINEVDTNGDLIVNFMPTTVRLVAGAKGQVTKVGQESIFIKTGGTKISGVSGVGREREGLVKIIAQPHEFVIPQMITGDCAGKILVGGSLLERSTIEKAVTIGVHGFVVGGINHRDFLSLGVGTDVGITVLITEGFGTTPIGLDIFEAAKQLENNFAFLSGEAKTFFIPIVKQERFLKTAQDYWRKLSVGDIVRVFRPGSQELIGKVEALSEREVLNSGLVAEVASVKFLTGKKITVPSANLEIVDA
ncbi:MAG: hypothetical protein WD231_03855 [Candidatus Woykebacteria bacterium]